jgi:hypothetical protein
MFGEGIRKIAPATCAAFLEVPIWNLKSAASLAESWKTKSGGNRLRFLFTARLRDFVGTP